jgi:hypothetical protein
VIRHDRYFSTCTHYINQISQTIRLVPGLSVAAIKAKLDKELSLWYCLRCINSWGSGVLTQQTAITTLVNRFNYSKSAAYRTLQKGNGIFWKKRNDNGITVIALTSLEKLAKRFNTRCGKGFLEISIPNFVGNGQNRLKTQRSWLYSTFFKPTGSKASPISRVSIEKATGIGRRSQQRYDKLSVKRTHNFANQTDVTGAVIPKLEYVDGKNRRWLTQKQLGNTYHNLTTASSRGIIRKINSSCNQSSFRREAWFRRFFISAGNFIKCPNKCPDPYISIKPKTYPINGEMQWCTP